MAIRYDALVTRTLAAELNLLLGQRTVEELHFDPARRLVRLVCDGDDEFVWLLHPSAGHLLRSRSRLSIGRRRNRGRGLLPSAGRVTAVRAHPDERRLTFEMEPLSMVVELHTNQWNALLLEEGTIRAALWARHAGGRALFVNAPYVDPGGNRRWCAEPPSRAEWTDWWQQTPDVDRFTRLVRDVAWTSRLNAGFLFAGGPDPAVVHTRLVGIHPGAGEEPDGARPSAWLLRRGSELQPYPHSLGEPEARQLATLLEAMEESAADAGIAAPGAEDLDGPVTAGAFGDDRRGRARDDEIESLQSALRNRVARVRKRVAALERQLSDGRPSGELREAGQLLLAHKSAIARGARRVDLPGFDGAERSIELDPSLDVVANAERCFQQARRRERAEREVPGRLDRSRGRVQVLEEALRRLATEGPTEELWGLAGGREAAGLSANRAEDRAVSLPYRRLLSRGGHEIRVGRSARGNDDLTFRHSSPDDIWLHARQAPGAHVILRWGRKEQNPPEAELRDAALAAAEYSDARSSGMVPVDWTRRKYVRKPRKSPPGAVIPDRVQTIFVEPDPGRVREMKEAGPDAP